MFERHERMPVIQAQTVISALNTIGKTNWRTSKHSSFTVFSFFFILDKKEKQYTTSFNQKVNPKRQDCASARACPIRRRSR